MVLPRPVYLTRPGKFVAGRILNVAAPEYPHQVSVVPRSPDTQPVKRSRAYPVPSPWEWVGSLDLTSIDLESWRVLRVIAASSLPHV